jgi:hypothetical protein
MAEWFNARAWKEGKPIQSQLDLRIITNVYGRIVQFQISAQDPAWTQEDPINRPPLSDFISPRDQRFD